MNAGGARRQGAANLMIDGGFVDLQVNGFLGVDFSEPGLSLDEVRRVASTLAARGTGAFCPTVVTSPPEAYESNLPVLAEAAGDTSLPCRVLGIHIEGPFISPAEGARGAHRKEHVRPPNRGFYDRMQELAQGRIALVTLAPELDGALGLIEHIAREGRAAVGIGHTLAGRDEVAAAVGAGARFSTHLGNGVPASIDRHSNPLWPQLAEDRLVGLFITDGHHLPPDQIKVALRAKGIDRFVVTSDAASVAGLPPGEYTSHGRRAVLEPSGRLSGPDHGYLAGSSACMLDCMNHLAGLGLLDGADLARAGRANALELLAPAPGDVPAGGVRVRFEDGVFVVIKGETGNEGRGRE